MPDRYPEPNDESDARLAKLVAQDVEDRGGVVVGMPATVAAALSSLDTHHMRAAILDANLDDAVITAVALRLLDAHIPFVVYTGTGLPADLRGRSAEITVVTKPGHPTEKLIELLAERR